MTQITYQASHEQFSPSALIKYVQLAEQAGFVKPGDLEQMVRISDNPEQHIQWLRQDLSLGFERIILHNVNCNQ